jgi:hypothetical protein
VGASAIVGEDIMHPLFIFGFLLHATALAVIGFFVLFAADRATGRTRRIGKWLGGWLFLLAALVLFGGIFALASGRVPGHGWMGGRRHGMMGGYPQGGIAPPAAPEGASGSAAPANGATPAAQ